MNIMNLMVNAPDGHIIEPCHQEEQFRTEKLSSIKLVQFRFPPVVTLDQ